MIIKTSHVRQVPRRFAGAEPADILELGPEAGFQISGDVRYELTAQRFPAELLVRGVLEMDVSGRCARCGERGRQTVRDPGFTRSYPLSAAGLRHSSLQTPREGTWPTENGQNCRPGALTGRGLAEDDAAVLSAANDELIDLTADIREAILLALPMNFLCSEACRGVCLQCGANLNKAPCGCGSPRFQTPWGMLDRLKLNRQP